MQNKVNFQLTTRKKMVSLPQSPLSRIYVRNKLAQKEIKSMALRPSSENTVPIIFIPISCRGKTSSSSLKHCAYQNSSELQQKSFHSKYQYSRSEKLEAKQRLVLLYNLSNISSVPTMKTVFSCFPYKRGYAEFGLLWSFIFHRKKPLFFLTSIPGKLSIEVTT